MSPRLVAIVVVPLLALAWTPSTASAAQPAPPAVKALAGTPPSSLRAGDRVPAVVTSPSSGLRAIVRALRPGARPAAPRADVAGSGPGPAAAEPLKAEPNQWKRVWKMNDGSATLKSHVDFDEKGGVNERLILSRPGKRDKVIQHMQEGKVGLLSFAKGTRLMSRFDKAAMAGLATREEVHGDYAHSMIADGKHTITRYDGSKVHFDGFKDTHGRDGTRYDEPDGTYSIHNAWGRQDFDKSGKLTRDAMIPPR